MGWQGFDSALAFRKTMVKLIDSRISTLRPQPRIGEVYSYDFSTMIGSVLFRGATDPIRVRFGRGQEPVRKKLDSADGSSPGDIVRVGGKAGAYYAMQVLDRSITDPTDPGGTPTTGYHFYPVNYGAIGDGVADDTQALLDCEAAIVAAGGGVMDLRHPLLGANAVYCCSAELTIHAYVDVIGSGGAFAGTSGSTIKLTSSTARVRFVGRGGMSYGWKVDGDGTGDVTGILKFDLALHRTFQSISSVRSNGHGILIAGTQNCTFIGMDAAEHPGYGWVLDDGAGGNLFLRCEGVGCLTGDLLSQESVGGPITYPWPAHNEFIHCIFETYIPTVDHVIKITAGNLRFVNCGVAVNLGTTMTGAAMIIVDAEYPVSLDIDGLLLVGNNDEAYDGISMNGISRICFSGDNNFQYLGTALKSRDTNSVVVTYGGMNFFDVVSNYGEETAGDRINWNVEWEQPHIWKLPAGDATWVTAWSVKQSTDLGVRAYVDNAGAYVLAGDGLGFSPKARFAYSVADDGAQITGGLRISNGFARGASTQTIAVAVPAAVTLDAKTSSNHRIVLNAACTGITINNAVDGKQISITTKQNATGGWAVTYPTNVRWIGGVAPTTGTANTRTTVHFEYDAVAGLWCEYMGRAQNVPTV